MRSSLFLAVALGALIVARPASAAPPQEPDEDFEVPASPRPAPPKAPVAPAAAPPPAANAATAEADFAAFRREVRQSQEQLQARIAHLEAELAAARASAPAKPGAAAQVASFIKPADWALSAYVQAQYEGHQDSEDEVQQGGVLLNQDRFLVRRGRLRLDAAWRYAELALEIDGSTTRGPIFGVRRAEATLVYRGREWDGKVQPRGPRDGKPPLAALTFGLSEIPFGFELVDSSRDRVFMERSTASLAFFPGEPDVGVRLSGGVGFFRYALAILNGEPVDDRAAGRSARDPNAAKDLVARIGADTRPAEDLRISGGVSALFGRGFHQGTEATKNATQWRDINENAAIDPGEVISLPGTAGSPSFNFNRWAVGLDLQVRAQTPIGQTMVYGEASVATNLDRGLFIADPILTSVDVRHVAAYAALTQEITRYGVVGFRWDYYDPNADFLVQEKGKLQPGSQAIHTFSPLVGLAYPDVARLVFQYDVVRDLLTKDTRGVPVDLANNRWTLRLQVQL